MKNKLPTAKRKRFECERDALIVTFGETEADTRFMFMSADEHLQLISDLQEALLRRSMYDGFMRRQANVK